MQTARLEPLHRFHPYCARFPSDIVEDAIATYSRPGDSIFDPFCGSGTTLVAGLAHARSVAGSDIDLLAGMLTELKCRPRPINSYRKWRLDFAARIASAFEELEDGWRELAQVSPGTDVQIGSLRIHIPSFPELNYWFPPPFTISLPTIPAIARLC